jgi:hypothetical protein
MFFHCWVGECYQQLLLFSGFCYKKNQLQRHSHAPTLWQLNQHVT